MTEIEQLERDILDLDKQIKQEEEEFSTAIKNKINSLDALRAQLENIKREAEESKKRKQEELKREIENIEEEKLRLAAREEELLAALEGKTPVVTSASHNRPVPHDNLKADSQRYESHSSYIPGPRHDVNRQEHNRDEQSSLRDIIYATRSAPVPSSMMGGTPLGSAKAVDHTSRPLQQPAGHSAPTFGTKKWEPAQMSSFNDEPSSTFKNEETLL